jgi:hypothetical protein
LLLATLDQQAYKDAASNKKENYQNRAYSLGLHGGYLVNGSNDVCVDSKSDHRFSTRLQV